MKGGGGIVFPALWGASYERQRRNLFQQARFLGTFFSFALCCRNGRRGHWGCEGGDGTKFPDIFVVASSRISPSVEKQRLLAPLFPSPPAPEIRFLSSVYYTTTTHKKKRKKSCYERGWPWLCVAFVRRERGTGAQTQQHTHMLLQQCDVANFGRGRGIRRRLGLLSAHSTLYALFSLSLSPLIKKAPPGGGNSEL